MIEAKANRALIAWMETVYELSDVIAYATDHGCQEAGVAGSSQDADAHTMNALPDCVISCYPKEDDFNRIADMINKKAIPMFGREVL